VDSRAGDLGSTTVDTRRAGVDPGEGPGREVYVSSEARTLRFARRGVRNSADVKGFMGALMSDLIEGRVSPGVGNAACNAGGKLLKVAEMEMKYGTVVRDGDTIRKELQFIDARDADDAE
jgi:hypothetical protein